MKNIINKPEQNWIQVGKWWQAWDNVAHGVQRGRYEVEGNVERQSDYYQADVQKVNDLKQTFTLRYDS